MSVKVTTELTCDNCKKSYKFVGDIRQYSTSQDVPRAWYKFGANLEHSLWTNSDYSIIGDFCSLECAVEFLQKKIEERDNPKSLVVGDFSFERYGD